MKVREAPLWVMSYDLALWIGHHVDGWEGTNILMTRLDARSLNLLECLSVALTFRDGRLDRIHEAQRDVVALEQLARLAEERGSLSLKQRDFVLIKLDEIGRMLSGWRRRELGRFGKAVAPRRSRVQG